MNKALQKLINEYGYELDNDGQIVIYTGYYEHDDGTISTEPQDGYDDEEEED